MPSFQAKIGCERLRKKENKNYRSDRFLPNPEYRIQKKKQKKLKKYHYGFFSNQNRLGKAKIKGKTKLSFRPIPTQLEIKNTKKVENTIMVSFQAKTYHSDQFLPDP